MMPYCDGLEFSVQCETLQYNFSWDFATGRMHHLSLCSSTEIIFLLLSCFL